MNSHTDYPNPKFSDQVCICVQTGEENSPGWEVKVTHLGNSDFRVNVDGVSSDVSLAIYSKVSPFLV